MFNYNHLTRHLATQSYQSKFLNAFAHVLLVYNKNNNNQIKNLKSKDIITNMVPI